MNNKQLLDINLTKIEAKYERGNRSLWTHKNYLELAEQISSSSKIHISQSSIKRLFGKIDYPYFPQIQTRNALSIYLGYNGWQDFTNSIDNSTTKSKTKSHLRIIIPIVVLLSILLGLYMFDLSTVELTVKNSIGNAPFQVSINYKLPYVDNADYCIDFDEVVENDCTPLDPKETAINYTFLHSDVYHISLKKGGKIIEKHTIVSQSQTWESLICTWVEGEGYCENLYASEVIKNKSILQVKPEIVSRYGFDSTDTYWIKHRYIKDLNTDGASFTFESRFRNQSTKNRYDCPAINFVIIGKEHNIKLSFATSGCIAYDHPIFEFSDKIVQATVENMSAFELNMEQWKTLNLKVNDLQLTASIDSSPIFQIALNKNIGNIFGIILDIKNAGEVDFVRIYNQSDELTFEDDF